MSLALYDMALYNKIHEMFDNVINADENSAFYEAYTSEANTQEEKKHNNIILPMISFWRTGNPPDFNFDGNYPQILKGHRFNRPSNSPVEYRTFPVNVSYQISIWSDTRREVDEIYREFCMIFFVDEPYLKIRVADEVYPDENKEEQRFVLDEEFSLQLMDSSTEIDTTSFSDRGRVYRQDIMIEIPNAKMFYFGREVKLLEEFNDSMYSISLVAADGNVSDGDK